MLKYFKVTFKNVERKPFPLPDPGGYVHYVHIEKGSFILKFFKISKG